MRTSQYILYKCSNRVNSSLLTINPSIMIESLIQTAHHHIWWFYRFLIFKKFKLNYFKLNWFILSPLQICSKITHFSIKFYKNYKPVNLLKFKSRQLK